MSIGVGVWWMRNYDFILLIQGSGVHFFIICFTPRSVSQSLNISADQEEMISVVGSLTKKTKRVKTEAVKLVY